MAFVAMVAGLLLLFAGGELLIRGAVGAARRLGLPHVLIGLVVVGFATSAPELVVAVQASLDASPGVAVGNVVGSDIANLLLILGTAALIADVRADSAATRREAVVVAAATVVLFVLGLTGVVTRPVGLVLILALVGYLTFAYLRDRRCRTDAAKLCVEQAEEAEPSWPGWAVAAGLAGGLAALVVGADLLVDGASETARSLGVSEVVIGLTIVAVGTSLPELAAATAAARKRHSEIVLGNVLGSNLFNTLGILGAAALVRPLPIDRSVASLDIPLLLVVTVALWPVLGAGRRIGRVGGALALVAYAGYVAFRFA